MELEHIWMKAVRVVNSQAATRSNSHHHHIPTTFSYLCCDDFQFWRSHPAGMHAISSGRTALHVDNVHARAMYSVPPPRDMPSGEDVDRHAPSYCPTTIHLSIYSVYCVFFIVIIIYLLDLPPSSSPTTPLSLLKLSILPGLH